MSSASGSTAVTIRFHNPNTDPTNRPKSTGSRWSSLIGTPVSKMRFRNPSTFLPLILNQGPAANAPQDFELIAFAKSQFLSAVVFLDLSCADRLD